MLSGLILDGYNFHTNLEDVSIGKGYREKIKS